ncbi:MAG: valine--tRNA ligase [Chitinophagales bacterium]
MSDLNSLTKVYNPEEVEKKWYDYWTEKGYFTPGENTSGKAFSIVMPPPNVTGSLHLGHAMDMTPQDILTRWRRMQGYNALWLPGTDHAGIATQAKVEESLTNEDLNKYDMGREGFLERVWEWKRTYGNRITNQLKKIGASCDWSRERFTMDEGCSRAVREVFVSLFEKNLIYQGDYIINWCPRCRTAISDIEVEHEEDQGHLWHIKYPVQDSSEYVVVATTRPETMLGDTGVAVHPDDERYQNLIGKNVMLPLMNRLIPVFADEYVDREFGTGAVKVTPAHDPNDFEMGLRHNLEQINIMDDQAIMNQNAGAYEGMERYDCRRRVVEDLEKLGCLLKIEEHRHAVGHCQRCDTVVEPLISKQWFVRMKPLAEPAIQKVLDGEIRFVPERFTKIYISWMENIRDWCISRQLWWGHRIPVWYCECGKVICSKTDPDACPECGSDKLVQDPDVLDTWFSSALWPFSTLGWPDQTKDIETYYPTSVLVTGRDIIFFWVARMIFSGIENTGKVPFFDVNIHGLVLDGLGRKMSKSLGNGIDPIEVIDKYGADTLRFSLINGVTPGNDVRFNLEKVENTRNFANKIWNASRFVLMNLDNYQEVAMKEEDLVLPDRWIINKLGRTINEVTRLLERYEFGEAARILYDFIWDDFCDWYIELVKPRLYRPRKPEDRTVVQNLLVYVLTDILKLLHPFMPFITEEIYQHLPGAHESIMIEPWPTSKGEKYIEAEEDMGILINVVRAIRNIRNEFKIPPGVNLATTAIVSDLETRTLLEGEAEYVENMANLSHLTVTEKGENKPVQALTAHLGEIEILVPLEGVIDVDKEVSRLKKELQATEAEFDRLNNKLQNQGFLAKAPQDIIDKERARLAETGSKREGIRQRLQMLTK